MPALFAVAAVLGGCALAPDVPEPGQTVPKHYRAAPAAASSAWPSARWWHDFKSRELDQLILQARRANPDIAAAAARVTQADAQIRVSGAALFPSMSAGASAAANYRHGASATGGRYAALSSGASRQETYKAALNASYEIDFWGKNRAQLDSAKASALASRFDRATVALGVDSSVATTYFTIVVLKDRLRIARENLGIAEQLLKAIQAQMHVGTGTALDVAQQETEVAVQRAAIPPLQQQLQDNINALAVLLGEPPERLHVAIARPSAISVPRVVPGLPSELLTRRPDVAQAMAQLRAARAGVQVAKAALFPSIDLTAQGGWQSAALTSLFSPMSTFYSLAASLTQPVFEGGRLRGQLAVNRGRYMELLADYHKSVISAFEDVDNALTDVRHTTRQGKLQQQAVTVARRAYRIARARLDQGITDVTTVLNTEQTLFNAEDTLARDRLLQLKATVSLYQALGGGWSRAAAVKAPGSTVMPRF